MLFCSCIENVSNIISTVIGSLAALAGVYFSFKQWKEEKAIQRETERKKLLTNVVGRSFGNMDYVLLQYRKFKNECEKESEPTNKDKLFAQLQKDTEQYVKEAEELINEAELKIIDENLINQLGDIVDVFIAIVTACSKEENTQLDDFMNSYEEKKRSFIKAANAYARSSKNTKSSKNK